MKKWLSYWRKARVLVLFEATWNEHESRYHCQHYKHHWDVKVEFGSLAVISCRDGDPTYCQDRNCGNRIGSQ